MTVTHVVGIDPGLVHTGVVRFLFDRAQRAVVVEHAAVAGPNTNEVTWWMSQHLRPEPTVFIESYRPRGNAYGTDERMRRAVAELKFLLPKAQVIDNTGMKKVVRRPLMELLQVWRFPTTTHHQDLRSAAMVALYGMLKDEALNELLADLVRAHLDGGPWHVQHR